MANFKVLIIGAGLGGLTLAQSLRRSGVSFQIFERDQSPWDRPQGYRLHLDADAINAAHEVLTPELCALFDATSQYTEPFTTLLKTDLSVVKRLPTDDDHGLDAWPTRAGPPVHCNVDRATLRQILLSGLEEFVHFSKRLVRYDLLADRVVAHFEDGTTVEGDVLVGADGMRSSVRAQRAPHAQTMNSGVLAVYGRIPMRVAEKDVPPQTLSDIFTVASDARKVVFGLGSVRFPTAPDEAARILAPGVTLRARESYMVCIACARPEYFPNDVAEMRAFGPEQLQQTAAHLLSGWPGPAATLVSKADPASFFLVEMFTSIPCSLDVPDRVTFVGDAIHGMTPTLGRGANVAMRDGTLLGRALGSVARGATSLQQGLAVYEKQMLAYGFEVVREAAQVGEQRMGQSPLPM